MPTIVPAQIRGARGMLGWSMLGLAKAASVSVSTVKRIEDGGDVSKLLQVQQALEAAGVEFLTDEGNGPGLRRQVR